MIDFQDKSILTGYIKELLVSFNLPTPKIYTKDTKLCKGGIYIKENNIVKCDNPETESFTIICPYQYNIPELYYTKNLKINSLLYDSHTHEYLGDYLRFQRDYNNLNLMSMYNCFSDNLVPSLNITKNLIEVSDKTDIVMKSLDEFIEGSWYNYSNFNDLTPIEGLSNISILADSIKNVLPDKNTKISKLDNMSYLKSQITWDYTSDIPTCTIIDLDNLLIYEDFKGEFDFKFNSWITASNIQDFDEQEFLKNIYKAFDSLVSFKTTDNSYKIYMIPVKFFKEYTIAISSDYPYELICGFYTKGLLENENNALLDILQKKTYQYIPTSDFNTPFLYSKLLDEHLYNNEYFQEHEDSLKLFLKMPITNNSTITILEGNYINWNSKWVDKELNVEKLDLNRTIAVVPPELDLLSESTIEGDFIVLGDELNVDEEINALDSVDVSPAVSYFYIGANKDQKVYKMTYGGKDIEFTELDEYGVPIPLKALYDNGTRDIWKNNKSIINYKKSVEDKDIDNINVGDITLISNLQLLNLNSGISHPFADKLISYLLDNTITHLDNISDNISRMQEALVRRYYSGSITIIDPETNKPKVISNKAGLKEYRYAGKWDDLYKVLNYDIAKETGLLDTKNDILGYVDKDIETALGKDVNIYSKYEEEPREWQ